MIYWGRKMDALKLAFDTLIVGALALPWLAMLVRMYLPPEITGKAEPHLAPLAALPEHTREAVIGIVILALGYFLGTAVSRISDDFFDDDELSHILPTELSIRESVYYDEYCSVHNVMAAKGLPKELGKEMVAFCSPGDDETAWRKSWSEVVMEFFRLQEGKLLLEGDDRTTRVRELHSQIVILRGATLNGLVLSTLCLFGFCISFWSQPWTWRKVQTHAIAIALVVCGGYYLWLHFHRLRAGNPHGYHDPPLAEGVMLLLGVAGLLVRAPTKSRWKYARGFGLSLALTIIAYGAWWWTEVMYNQIIIHSSM
jgi:hypothetical protein